MTSFFEKVYRYQVRDTRITNPDHLTCIFTFSFLHATNSGQSVGVE